MGEVGRIYKTAIFLGILFFLLFIVGVYLLTFYFNNLTPNDTLVGIVKEIKDISAGGLGTPDLAHVVLEDDREIVISIGVIYLEVGSKILTANDYLHHRYRVERPGGE